MALRIFSPTTLPIEPPRKLKSIPPKPTSCAPIRPKPVIIALHSFVLGGGIGMAGAADIIICSDCARFGVPEIDRGAMGGGAHLQRMFPVQKVRYMYFTGEVTFGRAHAQRRQTAAPAS